MAPQAHVVKHQLPESNVQGVKSEHRDSTSIYDTILNYVLRHVAKNDRDLFIRLSKHATSSEIEFRSIEAAMKYYYKLKDGEAITHLTYDPDDVRPLGRRTLASASNSRKCLPEKRDTALVDKPLNSSSSLSPTNSAAQSAEATERASPREDLKNEAKQIFACKVCLDEPVGVLFAPCTHLVSCVSCAAALTDCPVCRAPIKATIKVQI